MSWNIRGKTVLITGATDGIGKAAALELARQGARLVLLSRDKARGETVVIELKKRSGNEHIDMLVCDLSCMSSVAACAREIVRRYSALNVLIHGAGVHTDTPREYEGIEHTMAVNYFAPVLLTELLLPLLKQRAPARLIMVTSSMHKYGALHLDTLAKQVPFDGVQAYSNSKLALMLYALHLSRELVNSGVTVSAVHPGWIRTKLGNLTSTRFSLKRILHWLIYMRSPAHGAESIVYLATTEDVAAMNGAYVIKKRSVEPKPNARDVGLAEALTARTRLLLRDYLALR